MVYLEGYFSAMVFISVYTCARHNALCERCIGLHNAADSCIVSAVTSLPTSSTTLALHQHHSSIAPASHQLHTSSAPAPLQQRMHHPAGPTQATPAEDAAPSRPNTSHTSRGFSTEKAQHKPHQQSMHHPAGPTQATPVEDASPSRPNIGHTSRACITQQAQHRPHHAVEDASPSRPNIGHTLWLARLAAATEIFTSHTKDFISSASLEFLLESWKTALRIGIEETATQHILLTAFHRYLRYSEQANIYKNIKFTLILASTKEKNYFACCKWYV